MSQTVTPLDPDSTEGRDAARRLTTVLVEIEQAIAERERRTEAERRRAA
ncbi:MAG: hypothetical protein ACJ786_31245 [Catenulispora sp.]|jgi:hypothetical protein